MSFLNDRVTIHMLSDIMDEQEQIWERGDHNSLLVSGEGVLTQFHEAEEYPVQIFYMVTETSDIGIPINTVNFIWFDERGFAL